MRQHGDVATSLSRMVKRTWKALKRGAMEHSFDARKGPTDALVRLNGDVLVRIFEELGPDSEELCALSSTCRWLREASSPILFSWCHQRLGKVLGLRATHDIVPSTLWSYVRTLELSCCCPAYSQKDFVEEADPLVCNAFYPIHATLPAFPQLTTLHLRVQYIEVHGISWNTTRTILSLPHLRHLYIDGLYICPELLKSDNVDDSVVTPLATFHYTLPHYRQPLNFSSELTVLDFLIRKLHTSLESLVLPVESAPIQTISSLHWPQLREFTLQGERWSDPAAPLVSLFSPMPLLRSLSLELSDTEHVNEAMIWPTGVSVTFPWPELERLRVSHPDPADEIYAHVSSSLRTLSLRAWPHECIRLHDVKRIHQSPSRLGGWKNRWWNYPLSTPRHLSQVLQKCDAPLLHSLELEYRADAEELKLLQCVAAKFQHLTMLEIHRIRSEGGKDILVLDLAKALAPLASLRMLKLHLDFMAMPGPQVGWGNGFRRVPIGVSPEFDDVLSAAAAELSRTLAPSLEEIWMFKYDYDPLWVVFDITRAVVGGESGAGIILREYVRY